MRLEHLTITGFGPYADGQEIDFAQLHASGLFSVTGPTGSGKTTIFDALTYALYGTVPGARSEAAGSIRSHHVPPGVKTEVALEFTTNEGRWRVRRSPEYERPKSRGTGTTLQRAAVSLHRCTETGWQPISGNRHEIDNRLAELVGLRRDQFERVVLLPQGEFRRLLHARSRERRELFRTLFGTEAIERAVQGLRQHARQAAEAAAAQVVIVDEQRSEAEELLGAIEEAVAAHPDDSVPMLPVSCSGPGDAGDPHALGASLRRLEVGHVELSRRVLPALRAVEQRFRAEAATASSARDRAVDQAEAIQRRSDLVAEIAQVELALIPSEQDAARAELARRAQPVIAIERRRQKAATDFDAATTEAGSAHADLCAAAADAGEAIDLAGPGPLRDRTQRRLQELEDLATAAEHLTVERRRLADNRRHIHLMSERIHQTERALQQAETDRAASARAVQEAAAAGERLAELDAGLAHIERDLAVARRRDAARRRMADADAAITGLDAEILQGEDQIASLISERDALAPMATKKHDRQAALDTARRTLEEASKRDALELEIDGRTRQVSEAAQRVVDLTDRYIAGVAPRLAGELSEGAPCPVCGSCTHPNPARTGDGSPPVEESELDRAARDHLTATAALAALRATLDEVTLPGERTVDACETAVRAAETELVESQAAAARTADIEVALEQVRSRVDSFGRRRGEAATALAIEARRVDDATEALSERVECDVSGLDDELTRLRTERDHVLTLQQQAVPAKRAVERHDEDIDRWETSLAATREERAAALAASEEISRTVQQLSNRLTPLGSQTPAERSSVLTRLLESLQIAAAADGRLAEAGGEVARLVAERDRILAGSGIPSIDEALAAALPPDEIEELEAVHAELRTRLTEGRSALDQLDRMDIPADPPDLETLSALAEDAGRAAQRATEERIRVEQLEARARAGAERLGRHVEALDDIRAAADRAQRVASLCEGKGAARIGLEAYVLRTHLDQVVQFANLRLDSISAGRYRLRLADAALDGRNEWGLDLLIGDAHTGAERDVRSLSGGETFYTSLTLALGLSDVLSNRGATAVDSVFIDEGFGSLDPDVIDLTIDVLHQLQGDGVTVGVITHVEAVRDALRAGLVVERRPGGDSRVTQRIA